VRNLRRRDFLEALTYASLFATLAPRSITSGQVRLPTRREWERARDRLLAGMQTVMGNLPPKSKTRVEIVNISSEDLPEFTRRKITYQSEPGKSGEPGDYVPAYLLLPKRFKKKAPAMLCLHQTIAIGKDEPAGLGGNPDLHYAKELAERGYVTIVPDYPYLGENKFDPYKNGYLSCTMKGIVNHRRAIDVLESLPEVDRKHIGSIGHSLGGHNTLFVAAFDDRIKAMVTSCGFNSFRKYNGGDITGWAGKRYMPLIGERYSNSWEKMPFDFPELVASLAPRHLYINAPLHDSNFEVSGVRDCVDRAQPAYAHVFKAKDNLVVAYPDAGHQFPKAVRESAYAFLDGWAKR